MRILFQGDSITDAFRTKEDDSFLGRGYAHLIKAQLGFENPGKYEFYNRGISGNRIVDVYARIKKDIINLKPDVMSILIGVNDVWHETGDEPNGVDADKFYKIYAMLIEEVKEALPDVKIIVMEPFFLEVGDESVDMSYFKREVPLRAQMAKKIAETYSLKYITLQDKLDIACQKAPADYWLRDGVHPTEMGHELIKREWLKAFEEITR